jgi:hypothetical protein
MNFFLAGRDLIRWTVEIVDATAGTHHVRLTVQHPRGSIVEYFPSTEAALRREHDLEDLLIAARGFDGTARMGCER